MGGREVFLVVWVVGWVIGWRVGGRQVFAQTLEFLHTCIALGADFLHDLGQSSFQHANLIVFEQPKKFRFYR